MKASTRAVALLCSLLGACSSEDSVRVQQSALGSADLVVSQIYPGGGNTGAVLAADYVEIFNRGVAAVDLNGMSLQYQGAGTWTVIELASTSTMLAAGHYFLVKLAAGGTGLALPISADLTAGGVNLGAALGKVAVVRDSTALTCGAAGAHCSAVPTVMDYIGWGSAPDFEGTVYPSLSGNNNLVAVRKGAGCSDTDNNADDFVNDTWANSGGTATGVTLHHMASTGTVCSTSSSDGGASGGGTAPDLSGQDLSLSDDLPVPLDFSGSPDLTVPLDLITPPDLALDTDGSTAAPGLVVISQLYSAGGNSGATFSNDFVELFNRSKTTAVTIGGWTVQYASAANNFSLKADIPVGSVIAPSSYFLIKLAGGANGAALPTADLVGPSIVNLSASSAKVALVSSGMLLACGGATSRCSSASIIDLVGYGGASDFEGVPATAPANSALSLFRKHGGCIDTDNNSDDFDSLSVSPRNSSSAMYDCGLSPDLAVVGDLAGTVTDLGRFRDLSTADRFVPSDDFGTSLPHDLSHSTSVPDLGTSSRGRGGCSCGVIGGPLDAGAPMMLLLAGLGLFLRRRWRV